MILYHSSNHTWIDISNTTTPSPDHRYFNTLSYSHSRDSAILYGGLSGGVGGFSDVWEYRFATATWNQILPSQGSEPPPFKSFHSSLYVEEEDALYTFGGFTDFRGASSEGTNTLYKLTLRDSHWKKLFPNNNKNQNENDIPEGRSSFALVPVFRNRDEVNGVAGFTIFSGCAGDLVPLDAYYFDIGTV